MRVNTLSRQQLRWTRVAERLLVDGHAVIASRLPRHHAVIARGFQRLLADPVEQLLWTLDDPCELDSDGTIDLGLLPTRRGELKANPRPEEVAEGRIAHDANKHVLHYHPRLEGYLERKHRGANLKPFETMLDECFMAWAQSMAIGRCVAAALDAKLHGYDMLRRVENGVEGTKLRFVAYPRSTQTVTMGKDHRDKCFLTVHIMGDSSGLDIARPDGESVHLDETRRDQVILFFGSRAEMIASRTLFAAPHRVVNRNADNSAEKSVIPDMRSSLVTFIHADVSPEEYAAWQRSVQPIKRKAQLESAI